MSGDNVTQHLIVRFFIQTIIVSLYAPRLAIRGDGEEEELPVFLFHMALICTLNVYFLLKLLSD